MVEKNAPMPPQTTPFLTKEGTVAAPWFRYLENFAKVTRLNIGSLTSGVAQAQAEAASASAEAAAADENAASAISGGGVVTLSKTGTLNAQGTGGDGELVTGGPVVITINNSGGTGPYDWSLVATPVSGATVTPSSTGATGIAGPTITLYASATLAADGFGSASFKITVTDTITLDTADITVPAGMSNIAPL